MTEPPVPPLDPAETRIIEHGLRVYTHCILCGGELGRNQSGGCHTTFGRVPDGDCFSFLFWAEKYAWRLRGDVSVKTPLSRSWVGSNKDPEPKQYAIRIDGAHYAVQNQMVRDKGQFMGFGGATMYAAVTDGPNLGVLIKANNWWHQGSIPEVWRLMLPDNARFIEKEEYDRLIALHEVVGVDPNKSIAEHREVPAPYTTRTHDSYQ